MGVFSVYQRDKPETLCENLFEFAWFLISGMPTVHYGFGITIDDVTSLAECLQSIQQAGLIYFCSWVLVQPFPDDVFPMEIVFIVQHHEGVAGFTSVCINHIDAEIYLAWIPLV